jgi:hypothetical protein
MVMYSNIILQINRKNLQNMLGKKIFKNISYILNENVFYTKWLIHKMYL